MKDDVQVVTGAGGFIGGHLVARLHGEGYRRIRAVDAKPLDQWYQKLPGVENLRLDLREKEACRTACVDARRVFQLAADMGGMGFIETHKVQCMLSVLIDTHMLMAAQEFGVERYFYASSACAYNVAKQASTDIVPLAEADAYPAMPEDGYGWQKLFSERMGHHFHEDYGLAVRVGRYHNVYGPHGTWDGGREKAPAALCRKAIQAIASGSKEIEIWGSGDQLRSFTYIDDCLEGTLRLSGSQVTEPLNIGSDEVVSIDALVDIIEEIAGVKFERHYDPDAPKGVKGRSSDNTRIQQKLGWSPGTPLRDGLARTYAWIHAQYHAGRSGA